MLSYSVGSEQTDLFVVERDQAVQVHTVAVAEGDLERAIETLRELIREAFCTANPRKN